LEKQKNCEIEATERDKERFSVTKAKVRESSEEGEINYWES
jgi:hypothetical protein